MLYYLYWLSYFRLPQENTADQVSFTIEFYKFTVLRAGKSKITMLPELVSSDPSLPGLRTAAFTLCQQHDLSPKRKRVREVSLVTLCLLLRASVLLGWDSTLMTPFNLIFLQ